MITYYISTIVILALGLKISYTDKYLSSKSENNDSSYCIFSIQKQCKTSLLFLAFLAMAVTFILARLTHFMPLFCFYTL